MKPLELPSTDVVTIKHIVNDRSSDDPQLRAQRHSMTAEELSDPVGIAQREKLALALKEEELKHPMVHLKGDPNVTPLGTNED